MKTLVLKSFFIWVLSSVLIQAMVVPIDFSNGDYSFSIENVVRSDVSINGNTLTVPVDYTQAYLATIEVDGVEEDVIAQYNAFIVTSDIVYDGDDTLTPGERFELTLSVDNLYAVANKFDVRIIGDFGYNIEDTKRVSESAFERVSYNIDVPDNSDAGTYSFEYLVTDQYGTEYSGEKTVVVEREETMVITSAEYTACTGVVEYTVENYGAANVVDAIIRVEEDTLLDYDFISLGSGTGFAEYSGTIYADVTSDFFLRLYDSDGLLVDYMFIDYKSCTVVQTVEPSVESAEPVIPSTTVVQPVNSVNSVSTEFWDLTEAQVAAYLIVFMVGITALWTLLFILKYLLT